MRIMSDFREGMWGVVQTGDLRARLRLRRLRRRAPGRACAAALADPRVATLARGRPWLHRDLRRARCVIIGGGVGGHARSPTTWPSSAGATSCCSTARELTSGSTFHSAGPRRPAALVGVADADDDVLGRALPEARRRRVRPGLDRVRRHPAGLLARALGGDAPPGRLGEDVRAAARADLRRGGAERVPADGHRRRARRLVAADRRLPRPEPAHLRARRRRAPRRLPRSSPARA